MTTSVFSPLSPTDVHRTLVRHILADGLDVVFDFERSRHEDADLRLPGGTEGGRGARTCS
jgi:hypothetical protein